MEALTYDAHRREISDTGISVLPAGLPNLGAGLVARPLGAERLARAKRAFTVRRVPTGDMQRLLSGPLAPQPGDLVLARVERVGQHNGLQLPNGRRATLFVGNEIVVVYGNRYAPDQYEATVPTDLEPCDLIAGGGIAARMNSSHRRMKAPTRIVPLGLIANSQGQVLNLSAYRLPDIERGTGCPSVIAVVGTAMNAGKTTSATYLIRGLIEAGLKVGAAKITGTGASGDTNLMMDAGAEPVLDFTDAGLASTYLAELSTIEWATDLVMSHLCHARVDVIVAEIADGLFQRETGALLASPGFVERLSGIVFASSDAMGAAAGVDWLEQRGLPVVCVAGTLTMSPLAVREAQTSTRLPVLGLEELATPELALQILGAARQRSACPVAAAE